MGKVVNWILGFTKVGQTINKVREKLMGWKSYIAGLALVIPALIKMIEGFTNEGTPYLLRLLATEEYQLLLNGLAIMGLRAAISKAAPPASPLPPPVV